MACKECDRPAPRRCHLCGERLEEVFFMVKGHPDLIDMQDAKCAVEPPCGSCGQCLLSQALRAGHDVWPVPDDRSRVFWTCRGCGLSERIDQAAARFAAYWHHEQCYGTRPYIAHCREVVSVFEEFMPPYPGVEYVRAAAWLHDVIEDTPADVDWLLRTMGPRVAAVVRAVTKPANCSRRAGHEAMLESLRTASVDARLVKLSERIANVQSCVRRGNTRLLDMYRNEHPSMRALFAGARGAQANMVHRLDDLLTDTGN